MPTRPRRAAKRRIDDGRRVTSVPVGANVEIDHNTHVRHIEGELTEDHVDHEGNVIDTTKPWEQEAKAGTPKWLQEADKAKQKAKKK